MAPDDGGQRGIDVARELKRRAEHDPAFQAQFQHDPVGTLLAAGLPQESLAEALLEVGIEQAEVQGYVAGVPALAPRPGLLPNAHMPGFTPGDGMGKSAGV